MNHAPGLSGPEYLSELADRAAANGFEIEAPLLRELVSTWNADLRTIADLQTAASTEPNVGHEELAQLRAHSLAFTAIQAFRERAIQLIPAANLREVHWIEALMDGLVQARLLLADHLRQHAVDPGDDEDREHAGVGGAIYRIEDGRVVYMAPDATEADRAEAEACARRLREIESVGIRAARVGPISITSSIEHSVQSDFTVEQEDTILARGLAAYNALHPQAPLDQARALALITMIECAKGVVASEAPANALRAAA